MQKSPLRRESLSTLRNMKYNKGKARPYIHRKGDLTKLFLRWKRQKYTLITTAAEIAGLNSNMRDAKGRPISDAWRLIIEEIDPTTIKINGNVTKSVRAALRLQWQAKTIFPPSPLHKKRNQERHEIKTNRRAETILKIAYLCYDDLIKNHHNGNSLSSLKEVASREVR